MTARNDAANGFGTRYDESTENAVDEYRRRARVGRPWLDLRLMMTCTACGFRKELAGGRRIGGRRFVCKDCRRFKKGRQP
jgi:hypothetical protein